MQESRVGHQARLSFYLVMMCTAILLILMWRLVPELTGAMVWSSIALCGYLLFNWFFVSKTQIGLSFFTFFLSSLAFSLAFWSRVSEHIQWWLPILLIAIGIVLYLLFLPYIDTRMTAVAILGLALLSLIWSACEWWLQSRSWVSWEAFAGTVLLFVIFFRTMVYPGLKVFGQVSLLTAAGFQLALCLMVASILS